MDYTIENLYAYRNDKDKFLKIFNYFVYGIGDYSKLTSDNLDDSELPSDNYKTKFEYLINKVSKKTNPNYIFRCIIDTQSFDVIIKLYENDIQIHMYPELDIIFTILVCGDIEMLNFFVQKGLIFEDGYFDNYGYKFESLLTDKRNEMIKYLLKIYKSDEKFLLQIFSGSIVNQNVAMIDYILDNTLLDEIPTEKINSSLHNMFIEHPDALDENIANKLLMCGFDASIEAEEYFSAFVDQNNIDMFKYFLKVGIDINNFFDKN